MYEISVYKHLRFVNGHCHGVVSIGSCQKALLVTRDAKGKSFFFPLREVRGALVHANDSAVIIFH